MPSDEELWEWLMQMVEGLKFLKGTLKTAHRDLKPDNILIRNFKEEPIRLMISDFDTIKLSEKTETMTLIGTRTYMAPEVYEPLVKGEFEEHLNAF